MKNDITDAMVEAAANALFQIDIENTATIDVARIALEAAEAARVVGEVCGACGQPWTGEKCVQAANGWPYPVCYPVAASPAAPVPAEAARVVRENDSLIAELAAAQEWMRVPDYAERFSFADMVTWVNARPLTLFRRCAAAIRARIKEGPSE
jgi:hypothetical protein